MKPRFLFPQKLRNAGIVFLVFSIILAAYNYFHFGTVSAPVSIDGKFFSSPPAYKLNILINDAEYIGVIAGLLLIGFSREKIEDEQIAQMRLESLQWATYLNYSLLIICILTINGLDFLAVVSYNIMSQLVIFVIRFRWKVYQLNRSAPISNDVNINTI
jgi:hypothetical protein